jgi:hypothetical protein
MHPQALSSLRTEASQLTLPALSEFDRRCNGEFDPSQDAAIQGAERASDGPRLKVKEAEDMSATLVPVCSPVVQALRLSSIPALRRLAVEESETTVVILGRVTTYYLKQLAQETVMSVCDERKVENRVLVDRE